MIDKTPTPTPRTEEVWKPYLYHGLLPSEREKYDLSCQLERDLAAAREEIAAKDAEIARLHGERDRWQKNAIKAGEIANDLQNKWLSDKSRAERAEARLREVETERDAKDESLTLCYAQLKGCEREREELRVARDEEQILRVNMEIENASLRAERDALREQLNIECGGCPTTPTYAQLREENAGLRDELVALKALEMNHEGACVRMREENAALRADLREIERSIPCGLALSHAAGCPVLTLLARKHTNAADNPERG